MNRIVNLQQIGDFNKSILIKLKDQLKDEFTEFEILFEVAKYKFPLEKSDHNPKRRQYNASLILNKIADHLKGKQYFRTLGILDVDIFSGRLNFVFGLAMNPNGKKLGFPIVSLISIIRLREEFYRRPPNSTLFEKRVLKEAVHELGHTFGLEHCNKHCIMKFSNSLRDTDNKPKEFCVICKKKLEDYLNNLE